MTQKIPDNVPLHAATKKLQLDLAKKNGSQNVKTSVTPDVASSLRVNTPNQTRKLDFQSQFAMDAPPNSVIKVRVEKIGFFEANPRRVHDAESYQALKDSIRAKGVEQPVYITKRPNEENYVLAKGGNTRLKVMKELFDETQDVQYASMPCIFIPYSTDTDILFSHAVENEMHFEMCFWDKACLYTSLRTAIQSETGQKKFTLRDLVEIFNERGGLKVALATLSIMFFASEKLGKLQHLAWDLSHSKANKISKLYSKFYDNPSIQGQEAAVDACCELALSEWATKHSTEKELNIDGLLQYIEGFVFDHFPELVPSKEIAATDEDESNNTATNTPYSVPEDIEPEAVEPESPKVQNQSKDIAPEATPQSKAMAQQKIHEFARQLLRLVNLEELFIAHKEFQYGFYVEFPDLENKKWSEYFKKNPHIGYFKIDGVHSEARDVIYFLADLSGQEALCFEDNSVVFKLPADSIYRKSAEEGNFLDEIKNVSIGDRAYGAQHIVNWACLPESEFRAAFLGLLDATYYFNKLTT